MSWKTIDHHCFVATILFILSDMIAVFGFLSAAANRDHFESIDQLYQLDPNFIESDWEWTSKYRRTNLSFEIINALAWFIFSIPIIKVAWIQSNFGTRMMGLHITLVILALGGSFAELLSRLLALGSNNALSWMASKFNLDDWDVVSTVTNSTDGNVEDRIGWRTLEMIGIAFSGLLLWIDAIEFLFLSGVFVLLTFSIRTDNQLFSMRWAKFGFVLAVLGIIDFATAILRFEKWGLFSTIGFLINSINQLFLFPVWLIWLGRQLPKAEETRYAAKNAAALTESSDSMLT